MSTLVTSLIDKWSTNREGGVKKFEKLVYVDCESPLTHTKGWRVKH